MGAFVKCDCQEGCQVYIPERAVVLPVGVWRKETDAFSVS